MSAQTAVPSIDPSSGEQRRRPWYRLGAIALCAALTVAAADLVAWRLAPPLWLREVEDAVRELDSANPTVLAIGSSHGRTFDVMDDSLRARTHGRERILAVPVEWGKLSAYAWVLEHRLLPLLDERDGARAPRGRALRRAVIVTEWWDSCPSGAPLRNLPARSWTWRHFAENVRKNGLTAYNANFLSYRWGRLWRRSALIQDRGHGRLPAAARQRVLPSSDEARRAVFDAQTTMWRAMVEDGSACLGSESEMQALQWTVGTLQRRGLEVTVLLYPRMPVTLTERARATTLPMFAALVRRQVEPLGVRVIDLSSTSPLTDADFGADFDHVLPAGNARFAAWALDGPLRFLIEEPE